MKGSDCDVCHPATLQCTFSLASRAVFSRRMLIYAYIQTDIYCLKRQSFPMSKIGKRLLPGSVIARTFFIFAAHVRSESTIDKHLALEDFPINYTGIRRPYKLLNQLGVSQSFTLYWISSKYGSIIEISCQNYFKWFQTVLS